MRLEPRNKFTGIDDVDITIWGIKHYGARLMSHEKKGCYSSFNFLPTHRLYNLHPSRAEEPRKSYHNVVFTVIAPKVLSGNTWIMYGTKVILTVLANQHLLQWRQA